MTRYREEVINIRLADILRRIGFGTAGEIISKGKLPDVMVFINGLRIIIEGRFETSPQVRELRKRCKERVEEGICDIALGVIYPKGLREAKDDDDLLKKVKNSRFKTFIVFISSKGAKETGLKIDRIDDIAETLSHLSTLVVSNDILKEQIKKVNDAIGETSQIATITGLFFSSEIIIEKLKDVLGIKGR